MTALALIPTLTPAIPPRRAYTVSQLKTMATAICNRLEVIVRQCQSAAEAHNVNLNDQIDAIEKGRNRDLVEFIKRRGISSIYGAPTVTSTRLCATFNFVVTDPDECTAGFEAFKTASAEIERLNALKKTYRTPDFEAVLIALTDEAVFGTSEDISVAVYNRFVAGLNNGHSGNPE